LRERGAARFQRYCSACHGENADGKGVMASSLREVPPDLRRIAERNGGRFDSPSIAARIDGRRMATSHGSQEHPVWGWRWVRARKTSAGIPSPSMQEILAYLESIQIQPQAKPKG